SGLDALRDRIELRLGRRVVDPGRETRERLRPCARYTGNVEREPPVDVGHRRVDPEIGRHDADHRPAPCRVPTGNRLADDAAVAAEVALPETVADHERLARIAFDARLVEAIPPADHRLDAQYGQRAQRDAAEADPRCAGGTAHGDVDAAGDTGADAGHGLARFAPRGVHLDGGRADTAVPLVHFLNPDELLGVRKRQRPQDDRM